MPTQVWSSKNRINTINRPIFALYVRENDANQIRSVQSTLSTVIFTYLLTFEFPKLESTFQTNQVISVNAINNNFLMPTQVGSFKSWINTINIPNFDPKQIRSPLSTLSTGIFTCPLRCEFKSILSTLCVEYFCIKSLSTEIDVYPNHTTIKIFLDHT